jgi:hypothetical protein
MAQQKATPWVVATGDRFTICRYCQGEVLLLKVAPDDPQIDDTTLKEHYGICESRQSKSGTGLSSNLSNVRSSTVPRASVQRGSEASTRKSTNPVSLHNMPKGVPTDRGTSR